MKRLTNREVGKRRCYRCGRTPGVSTWNVCADHNRQRVVCRRCDIALNRLVLRWMRDPGAAQKLAWYIRKCART